MPRGMSPASATRFRPGPLRGALRVAPDKSISHRALLIGALTGGELQLSNLNTGADLEATRQAVRALGARLDGEGGEVTLHAPQRLHAPGVVDCLNSGTTMRLLMGILAGANLPARLTGDDSLSRRPMERVAGPLRDAGALITTTNGHAPVELAAHTGLKAVAHHLRVPSAQVKTALLLAALTAGTSAEITGDEHSRDHTERMLRYLGASIAWDGTRIALAASTLNARDIEVPGDPSAAAFAIVGALVTPHSEVRIERLCLNPTRDGLLRALQAMGADLTIRDAHEVCGEPVGDVVARSSSLHAIDLDPALLPTMIDEVPALAVAAAYARGTTRIRNAAELRVKESDRVETIAAMLEAAGVTVARHPDGLDVSGAEHMNERIEVASHGDHRIAMAAAALAAGSPSGVQVDDAGCARVSYPQFHEAWEFLQQGVAR
ncbi:3-phosphoshikimate 1-carboxyvinyltransferase [bacterium]|nr:MAG: 3-phosphoshikimate 1-carboxyvinyltransferase [bacterium]